MKKSTVDNIIIMTILNGPESSIFLYVSKVYCHCLQYDCVLWATFKPAVVV